MKQQQELSISNFRSAFFRVQIIIQHRLMAETDFFSQFSLIFKFLCFESTFEAAYYFKLTECFIFLLMIYHRA